MTRKEAESLVEQLQAEGTGTLAHIVEGPPGQNIRVRVKRPGGLWEFHTEGRADGPSEEAA